MDIGHWIEILSSECRNCIWVVIMLSFERRNLRNHFRFDHSDYLLGSKSPPSPPPPKKEQCVRFTFPRLRHCKPTFYFVVLLSVISVDPGYDTVERCAAIPVFPYITEPQSNECLIMNVLLTMNVDSRHSF
jgi:hypothetical protein